MKSDKTNSLIVSLLVRLWRHNSKRRQRQFVGMVALTFVSAFAEVISLGAVLPFLGILTAPERVFDYDPVGRMAKAWGMTSANQLVLPLTLGFALAAVVAAAIRMLLLAVSTRLAFASASDLSIEIYRRTLYQPYKVHLARNSSEIISGVTSKVGGAINVLNQFLTLISSVVLLVFITIALIAIDPFVAVVAIAGFSLCYGLITWISRRKLHRNSQRIAYEETQVVKALQEGLGGIRDVLLDGTQPLYCNNYRKAEQLLRGAQSHNAFISQSPRYAMEALGMVLIAALAYSLSRRDGGMATALPVLGALALGAQRLLPALQQGYSAWANIVGSQASLADVLALLDQPLPAEILQSIPAALPLIDAIRFDSVNFRYAEGSPWVLNNFNLTVPVGSRVGFVGSTGSGKSTALDLLMGLIEPTEGRLLVDDQIVCGERLRAWQRTIAHVPQSVYLADASLAENIAFGVPRGEIDMDRVRHAASQAQIAEFIESSHEGYDAFVGERGVRLSGGQRQRIGIARALYKQASVLVFDEATSALDTATEQSVMNAIEGLNRSLTVLIIAHRLSTVRRCDTIVELQHGEIVAQGSYEQLLEQSPSFRKMAFEVGGANI
jgi:ATP-binding cassette subfamily B protein